MSLGDQFAAAPRWTGPTLKAGQDSDISPYMARALELAWSAVGRTSPNPPVGAVLVRGRHIVGEGSTQPAGQEHAEVVALRQAGSLARGATLYVSLEPCSHYGRTPPCTDAIIAAGVVEVHASVLDVNPRVGGSGIEKLRQAGVKVQVGEGQREAEELAAPHTKLVTTGRPLVTVKFAMSLDGKIATRTGDSKWITSEESRKYVHQLRSGSDAIMVGIGTVVADDPQLTVRKADGSPLPHQPLRVVVDSSCRIPPDATLLKQPGSTLVAVAGETRGARTLSETADAEVLAIPGSDKRVNLYRLLDELGRRGISSLFVEGGGTLLGSLFDARLVDRVVGFVAPVLIGGDAALSPVGGRGAERMADALRLNDVRIETFGDDVTVTGWCSTL